MPKTFKTCFNIPVPFFLYFYLTVDCPNWIALFEGEITGGDFKSQWKRFGLISLSIAYHYRLNHPVELKKRRKTSQSVAVESGDPEIAVAKDYEFARNELAQAQDAR